ncbi:MAG: hypothetical protein MRJ93_06485 [Nitrososphaeraceae archaeon]|nr:hypothetical protein [Nitrososphaeraceae archaeon]
MNLMVNARPYLIVFTLFPLLTTLGLYSFLGPVEIFSFSDDKIVEESLESPSIAQLPSLDEQSQFGYIILSTNIINDEKSNQQTLDFTINVMETNGPPSSFKAVQPPQIQVIPVKEGDYKISINDAKNSEIFLGEQCEGIMNSGEVKSCEINVDYPNGIHTLSVENKSIKHSLPLSELLSPPNAQIEDKKKMLEIAEIPKPSDTSKVGFLILSTKIINNNGGNKQASDFIININGTPAFPPSFKAAPSNLIQIVSLTEGPYSVSVNDVPGYNANFELECSGQIDAKQIKSCLINIDDISSTTSCPAGEHFDAETNSCVTDTTPPPISCPAGMHYDPITKFCEIDTTQPPPITCPAGQHLDTGTNTCVPDTTQPPPITCPAGQHLDTGTNTCVPDTTQPPPSSGSFPVQNVQWYYDSQSALSKDITIPSGKTAPNDPVLLSSGASGVKSHTIKDGWLEVQSGGGNGRVYWDYHDSPQFSQLPTAGFNTVMTGIFMLKPGIDNLSIKDGNHGTNGWSLDGQYVFGGFGLSIHRDEIQSKVEYWHNNQGRELSFPYPNGIKLVDNKEYKFFLTIRTDRTNQEVVLNVWLDFGEGKGWIHVVKDRKWGKNDWDPGSVPNGGDKQQIEQGPSFIKKHHIWTRANGDAFLPVKDIKIGTIDYIS